MRPSMTRVSVGLFGPLFDLLVRVMVCDSVMVCNSDSVCVCRRHWGWVIPML